MTTTAPAPQRKPMSDRKLTIILILSSIFILPPILIIGLFFFIIYAYDSSATPAQKAARKQNEQIATMRREKIASPKRMNQPFMIGSLEVTIKEVNTNMQVNATDKYPAPYGQCHTQKETKYAYVVLLVKNTQPQTVTLPALSIYSGGSDYQNPMYQTASEVRACTKGLNLPGLEYTTQKSIYSDQTQTYHAYYNVGSDDKERFVKVQNTSTDFEMVKVE